MTFDPLPGTYRAGQYIPITCEVPRVKGNISEANLQLFVRDIGYQSTLQDNPDGTNQLLTNGTFLIPSPMGGSVNVTCIFLSPFGDLQCESQTIKVLTGKYYLYVHLICICLSQWEASSH